MGRPCRHATETVPVCAACEHNRARVAEWAARNGPRVSRRRARWERRNRRKRLAAWARYETPENRTNKRRAEGAARRGAVLCGPVDAYHVWKRDRERCHLCGLPVPSPFVTPTDTAERFTLDHLVPASLGGEHSYGNVRAAHHGCNARRGTAPDQSVPMEAVA